MQIAYLLGVALGQLILSITIQREESKERNCIRGKDKLGSALLRVHFSTEVTQDTLIHFHGFHSLMSCLI